MIDVAVVKAVDESR